VLIPTRGFGKCPKPTSEYRYEKQECNSHKCVGDETCVARQDLIMAIDGSGSLLERASPMDSCLAPEQDLVIAIDDSGSLWHLVSKLSKDSPLN